MQVKKIIYLELHVNCKTFCSTFLNLEKLTNQFLKHSYSFDNKKIIGF